MGTLKEDAQAASWVSQALTGSDYPADYTLASLREIDRFFDEEFLQLVNEQWWQEAYLLSGLVYELHRHEKVPGPGQCYALAPHPALGGPNPARGDPVDPRFVMVMDLGVWQSLCVQSLRPGG